LSHILKLKELKKAEKIALQAEERKLALLKEQIYKIKAEIDQLQNKCTSQQEIDMQYRNHFKKQSEELEEKTNEIKSQNIEIDDKINSLKESISRQLNEYRAACQNYVEVDNCYRLKFAEQCEIVDVLNQLNLQFNRHIVAGIGSMPELR
jgi:chromosome segregation ATPase